MELMPQCSRVMTGCKQIKTDKLVTQCEMEGEQFQYGEKAGMFLSQKHGLLFVLLKET